MRKGTIFILIGVALAVLSVPLLLGFTLYDQRTINTYEFEESDDDDDELRYTFKDIEPGNIAFRSRGFLASNSLHVKIFDEDTGNVVDEYDMDPGTFTWEREDTRIRHSGDYTVSVIVNNEDRWLVEINAKYSADYSSLGLITAVLGFPTFLLAGIAGIILGSVKIYRKRMGIEEGATIRYDEKYEEHITYIDEKKEEFDDYETSPRRKELWFEPSTNPYDDIPPDYFEQKRKESLAFDKKWHQRLGDDLEGRLTGKKKEKKRSAPKTRDAVKKK